MMKLVFRRLQFFLLFILVACNSATPTPDGLTIAISSPTGTAYTNGTLNIQIVVSNGTADSVELVKDDIVLVSNLAAPYTYAWNTTSEAEGSYTLKARARRGSEGVESEQTVTVVIDRTAPTIIERTPAPGADNVLYSAPITVKFSEPMLASTLTTANIQLVANNLPVSLTPSLAADGLTLTLQAAKGGIKDFDTQPELTLSKLTDRAGNELPLSNWGWKLPSWLTVGGSRVNDLEDSQIVSFNPDSLELDSSDHPVVVVNEIEQIAGDKGPLYVKRWTGTAWQRLGDNLTEGSSIFVTLNALALDSSGNPVVAFYEPGTSAFELLVKRWDGSSWVQMGTGSLNINPERNALPTSLSLDAAGNPVLAFFEYTNQSRPLKAQLYVKRWTGTAWQLVGTGSLNQNPDFEASDAALALDASGNPLVAWSEYDDNKPFDTQTLYVKRWTGTAWQLLGEKVNTFKLGFSPSLVLDASGQALVAYVEKSDTANPGFVHVKQFNGTAWQDIEGNNRPVSELTENASNVSLRLDASARPVVRYSTSSSEGNTDHFKHFENSSWQVFAKTVTITYSPTLALDSNGEPFIAAQIITNTVPNKVAGFVLQANH